MPRRGRPLRPLELSEDERAQLGRWTRRRHTAAGLAQRARMVLLAAEGLSNREVAARLGCSDATVGKWRARFLSDATVGKWRARFLEHRLAGLVDEPRSGRPRSVTDEMVQDVVIKTLESTAPTPPTGRRARWPRPRSCPRPRSARSGGPSSSSPT